VFNKVILFGRLSEPPDLYNARSGMAICRLKIETRTRVPWREEEHREWTVVKLFGAQAEGARFWKTGDLVNVEGHLHTARWDRSSPERTTEIVGHSARRVSLDGAEESAA
jgi:single-stranded DNA-binding protein